MSKTNDEKVNELFLNNMRLVPYIYIKYKSKLRTRNVDDLLQEGYIGLLRACNKYDSTRGTAFSTFAWSYIYGHMLRFCNQDKLIHIPIYKLKEIKDYYIKTTNELDYIMDDELEVIKNMNEIIDITEVIEDDALIYNQFDIEFYDKYNFNDVFDITKDILSDREYNIVTEYVLDDDSTLESIGKKYGLTKERIRQIIARSFFKLRQNDKFKEYYEEL